MRKMIFAAAVAALTMGAALTSFASGWQASGDDWYYYDNSGNMVTNAWKTSNGGYYYLGDDGAMERDTLIEDGDDYYYVDSNGERVVNMWVAIEADSDDDTDALYRWYYFGTNGQAYTDSVSKTINGKKYGFDEDGKMLFGYVDEEGEMIDQDDDDPILEATYYFGTNDDGERHTGWLLYSEGLDDDDDLYEDYDEFWFYFNSNGKKETSTTKKINGYNYVFDENGVMLYEFVDTASDSDYVSALTATSAKYYSGSLDDGSLKKNSWIFAEIPEDWDLDDDYEDEAYWFRTNSSGYLLTDQTKKINSKWYAFDENGVMLDGLVELSDDKVSGSTIVCDLDMDEVDKESLISDYSTNIFYFSADGYTDGSMKTGSSVKVELADDTYTFGFNKNGSAYHGVKSNKVYDHGLRLEADSDEKYEIVEVDGLQYVVSTNGTRQKAGKYVKTGDDTYLVIISGSDDEGYVIEEVDDKDEAKELLD